MKKTIDSNEVAVKILNEVFSHGITFEDLNRKVGISGTIEIRKRFEEQDTVFIFHGIIFTVGGLFGHALFSIAKSFEAQSATSNGEPMNLLTNSICEIDFKLDGDEIDNAKIVLGALAGNLYHNKPDVTEISRTMKPDTHEARVFLEQLKILLEDETFNDEDIKVDSIQKRDDSSDIQGPVLNI